MIGVYITCTDKKEAKKIAMHLLKNRLIACANVFPTDSFYWWKGKIVEDKEVVLFAKTLDSTFPEIIVAVKKLHSYSIPCISKIPENADLDYLEWLKGEVK